MMSIPATSFLISARLRTCARVVASSKTRSTSLTSGTSSGVAWDMATWLPAGNGASSREMIPAGSASLATKCRMDRNSSATGSLKSISSRSERSARIESGSSMSRPITAVPGTPCSMLRECASTIGSWST